MRILLVEDDTLLAAGIAEAFRRHHDTVDMLNAAEAAEAALSSTEYDLAIFDVGLPGMDGFELVRRVRHRGLAVPILMLTARDSVQDRVRGLNSGADDYLVKPFSLEELIARGQALLRRSRSATASVVSFGPLRMDMGVKQAWVDELPLELTAREWVLMQQLMLAAPNVVSKSRLVDALGSWDREVSGNAVEINVSRLRTKLGASSVEIRTMRGLGYRLAAQPAGGHPAE